MKTGRELEEALLEVLRFEVGPNDEGLYGFELIGSVAEWGDPTPNEQRLGRQALARLVKRGEVTEDRGTDANGLPIYKAVR